MMRMLSALFLSLVLALTSHSAAVAKGAPMAVDQMVICTGFGAKVIYTDAEGQPTSTPRLCPDCVMHLGAALLPGTDAAVVILTVTLHRVLPQADMVVRPNQTLTHFARAPPVVI